MLLILLDCNAIEFVHKKYKYCAKDKQNSVMDCNVEYHALHPLRYTYTDNYVDASLVVSAVENRNGSCMSSYVNVLWPVTRSN